MFGNLTLAKDDLQVLQITEFASMGLPLILFRLSSSNRNWILTLFLQS